MVEDTEVVEEDVRREEVGLSDAITDLIANSVGALAAAFVALAIHGRAKRPA